MKTESNIHQIFLFVNVCPWKADGRTVKSHNYLFFCKKKYFDWLSVLIYFISSSNFIIYACTCTYIIIQAISVRFLWTNAISFFFLFVKFALTSLNKFYPYAVACCKLIYDMNLVKCSWCNCNVFVTFSIKSSSNCVLY